MTAAFTRATAQRTTAEEGTLQSPPAAAQSTDKLANQQGPETPAALHSPCLLATLTGRSVDHHRGEQHPAGDHVLG